MPYANNRGIRIYYEVEGEGAPLLLYHGQGLDLTTWREAGFTDVLRQNYRLILMDARGHGRSDKPHFSTGYTLRQQVGDVVAVLDKLAVKHTHFLGYSLGGWVGFGLAKYAPERLISLSIGGAHPYADRLEGARRVLEQGAAGWVGTLEQMGVSLPAATRARLLASDAKALWASVAADRPDISDVLPDMTLPCLLYAGEADPRYPLIERSAYALDNASLLTLPGLNHVQAGARPDLVLRHVVQTIEAHNW